MTEQEVKNEADLMAANTAQHLQTQFVALAHKHATVSYALIGVLIAVLVLAGVGGYIGLKFADAQIARAEQKEVQYNTDRKAWQDKLAADDAARAAATAQQQVIVKVVDTRDKATDKAIQEAVKPGADLQTVAKGLQAAYNGVPGFEVPVTLSGLNIALTGPQAQQVTAYKLDRDRLSLNLADTKSLFDLERTKTVSLQSNLSGCESILYEADDVSAAWKKAAKASKWTKFVHGAKIGGGIALTAILSYELGHKR